VSPNKPRSRLLSSTAQHFVGHEAERARDAAVIPTGRVADSFRNVERSIQRSDDDDRPRPQSRRQSPRAPPLIAEPSSQPVHRAKVRQAFSELPLLYSRRDAAHLLSCSVETLIRLERQGDLNPIRINKKSPTASVYYRREELLKLASGDHDAS
jgi:hypothetical protein